jgi:hypothetical protein
MIVRAVALKNASVTGTACACTGFGQGTVVDLGGRACDLVLYAGLQVLSSGADGIKVFIQANSSSGYFTGGTCNNPGTDVAAFTSRACRDGQLVRIPWNCASATSTQRNWYRAAWSQTCTDTDQWLAAMDLDLKRP